MQEEITTLIARSCLGALTALGYTYSLTYSLPNSPTADQFQGIAALGAVIGTIAPNETLEATKALPTVVWSIIQGICQASMRDDPVARANRDAQRFNHWRQHLHKKI